MTKKATRSTFYSVALLLASTIALIANSAPPDSFSGKVISVADGDTLTVLVNKESIRVRLEGIDAPEAKQDFGTKAKRHLQTLVDSKEVRVESTGTDKYGRTLGTVYADGQSLNQRMVEDGFAWHYKQFNDDPKLSKAETKAKANKAGLWSSPNQIPPWEFRRRQNLPVEFVEVPQPIEKAAESGAPLSKLDNAKAKPAASESLYWLNTKSGVRHNPGCQYYGSTKSGRKCTKDEGRACGICGG